MTTTTEVEFILSAGKLYHVEIDHGFRTANFTFRGGFCRGTTKRKIPLVGSACPMITVKDETKKTVFKWTKSLTFGTGQQAAGINGDCHQVIIYDNLEDETRVLKVVSTPKAGTRGVQVPSRVSSLSTAVDNNKRKDNGNKKRDRESIPETEKVKAEDESRKKKRRKIGESEERKRGGDVVVEEDDRTREKVEGYRKIKNFLMGVNMMERLEQMGHLKTCSDKKRKKIRTQVVRQESFYKHFRPRFQSSPIDRN